MGPEGPTDEDLLGRFLQGETGAFDELVRRHEDRIFGLAMRMTGERSDALEATQEAFIAAFRRASSFRGDSAFGTWLYRIAINTCKDLLRKRRPAEHEPAEQPSGRSSVEDAVTARVDVSRALARLPDEYREAVVMHDLGGISYEEIASLTDSKIGTVKSRISRGRRMLAEMLEQHGRTRASKGKR